MSKVTVRFAGHWHEGNEITIAAGTAVVGPDGYAQVSPELAAVLEREGYLDENRVEDAHREAQQANVAHAHEIALKEKQGRIGEQFANGEVLSMASATLPTVDALREIAEG